MSRMLPGVILVVGVGLAVAAAWGVYRALDDAPLTDELVGLSIRAAHSKPTDLPPADPPLTEERPAGSALPTAQPTGSGVSDPPGIDQPSSTRPPASTGSASTASDMERLAASAGVDKATVGRLIRGTIDAKPEGAPSPAPVPPQKPAKIVHELSTLELPADPEGMTVRAMASAPGGDLYVAMGLPLTLIPAMEKGVSGRIRVFDDEGKETVSWSVEGFVPQSVTVAADGTVYVGGQGRLASYTAAGKLIRSRDLLDAKRKEISRSIAEKGAAGFRDRTTEFINIAARGLDAEIAQLERNAEGADGHSAAAARLKAARDTRDEIKSRLAEINRHSLADWRQSVVDSAERINGIVVGADDMFILEGTLLMRYTADDPLPMPLLASREPSFRQIRPAPGGFAGLDSDGKVARFDREGTFLPNTKITSIVEPSIGDPGGAMVLAYSLGLVEADRLIVLDSRQRVRVWESSGGPESLWEPAKPQTGDWDFEVSADGERIYIGDVGRRRIVRLAYSPPRSKK